ncbi:polysaccharide deacetylase family protein [Thermodesulfobacteriota bacterium]
MFHWDRFQQWLRSVGSDQRQMGRRAFIRDAGGSLLLASLLPPLLPVALIQELAEHHFAVPQQGEALPNRLEGLDRQPGNRIATGPHGYVFLTFDDGPLFSTPTVLNALERKKHKATFFVVGRNFRSRRLRRVAIKAVELGHELANHSYTHPSFAYVTAERARWEILETHKVIEEAVKDAGAHMDSHVHFFRYPYGNEGNEENYADIRALLEDLGYQVAWWDVDTLDWRMSLSRKARSPRLVVAALGRARQGDVVLLHDRRRTAGLLPHMLALLESKQLYSVPLSSYGSVRLARSAE